MSLIVKTVALGLFVGAEATILSAPIRAISQEGIVRNRVGKAQEPLGLGSSSTDTHNGSPVKSAPFDFTNYAIHTANISIGTPPQYFQLAIDNTQAFPLLVPSVEQGPVYDIDPTNHYNSSLSSTYQPVDEPLSPILWSLVNFEGRLARDDLHIQGVKAPHTLFGEYQQAAALPLWAATKGYDGFIGLAPPWHERSQQVSSLLYTLGEQKVLDSNIFSVKLPRNQSDEGELMLGGFNSHLATDEIIRLPLVNRTDKPYQALWTVSASSITLETSDPILFHFGANGYAILNTHAPYIFFPPGVAERYIGAMNATSYTMLYFTVPCDNRANLPLMTFGLSGHNFTLDGFDYTVEREIYDEVLLCFIMLMDSRWAGSEEENIVWLGAPFFKRFYSIFDWENKELGVARVGNYAEQAVAP